MATDEMHGARQTDEVLTCFVTTPPFADRHELELLLEQEGLRPVATTDFPAHGLSATEAIRKAIEQADIVVGLLPEKSAAEGVLVELGMAAALHKPVVIVTETGAAALPQLEDALWAKVAPGDYTPLRYTLQRLRRRLLRPRPPRRSAPPPKTGLGSTATELAERLQQVGGEATEEMLTQLLVETFSDAGVVAVGRETPEDRFDIGIWSDDASWVVGSPLMIEVKQHVATPIELEQALRDVTRRLEGTNVQWALLVYAAGLDQSDAEAIARQYPVLVFRADELLEDLHDHPLAEVLRRVRNERVHG